MTPHPREYSPDDIGRRVNRFRGFGDSRESRTDKLLAALAAADAGENPSGVGL